jgi:Tfp pilus assembly protein PilF
MERFTALDEYGVALLNSAHKPDLALQQFTQAIETAPKSLKPTDAELAYVYWHRGVAASQTGNDAQAKQDFAVANESMKLAEAAIGIMNNTYYRQLEERLAIILQSQHP